MDINTLEINYFDFIRLNNLYIEGQNQDTLIYANQLSVDYNLQNLFKSEIELDKVLEKKKLFNG